MSKHEEVEVNNEDEEKHKAFSEVENDNRDTMHTEDTRYSTHAFVQDNNTGW